MGRPKERTDQVRQRLLEEALRLLEIDGPPAIRARTVAGAAGSSTGALYELFGDKAGLIRGLFYESFRLLDTSQRELAPSGDPRADLVALLDAGREFALDHPMLFDLMFGRPFEEFDPTTADSDVAIDIHRRMVGAVADWLRSVGRQTSPRLAAELLVATHRGLIASELAGTLGRSPSSRARKYQLGVEVVMAGLEAMDEGDR